MSTPPPICEPKAITPKEGDGNRTEEAKLALTRASAERLQRLLKDALDGGETR